MVMMSATGIRGLDECTGGVPGDGVTLLAGKHGSGKTMLLLAAAFADKRDSVIISTTTDYSRLSETVRSLCTEYGWKHGEVRTDISSGMWIIITTPLSTIRFAGPMTREAGSLKRIMSTVSTMVDSKCASSVYLDNPLHNVRERDDIAGFMEFIHGTARNSNVRVVMTTRVSMHVEPEHVLSAIPKQVRKNTDLILYTPTWPKVDGTDTVIETTVLYDYVDKTRRHENGDAPADPDNPHTVELRFDRTAQERIIGEPQKTKPRKQRKQ